METVHKHLYDKYVREVTNQRLTDIQRAHELKELENKYNLWFCCRVLNVSTSDTNNITYDIEYFQNREIFKFEDGLIFFENHQLVNLLELNEGDVIKVVCNGNAMNLLSWEKVPVFHSNEYKEFSEPSKPREMITKASVNALEIRDAIYYWKLWIYGFVIVAAVGGIAYMNQPAEGFIAVILMIIAGVVFYGGGVIVLIGFIALVFWSLMLWLQKM